MSAAPRSADAVLERLLEGNARFAADRKLNEGHDTGRREELAAGQEPDAVVLGCADSRVPPDVIFDAGLGELFVVRVAGNTAGAAAVLGSVEFAVTQLGSPLVLVLGHEGCGAVAGAVAAERDGESLPGAIDEAIAPIAPVVATIAQDEPQLDRDALVERAVVANVEATVGDLVARSPAVAERVESGATKVVGAVYRLGSGRIDLL